MEGDRFLLAEPCKYCLTCGLRRILSDSPRASVTVAHDVVIGIELDCGRSDHGNKILDIPFGEFYIDLLVFLSAIIRAVGDISPTVHVIDCILAHVPEVSRDEPLNVISACSSALEALIVDLLFNAIEGGKSLFVTLTCYAVGEHEFSRGGHLQLDLIKIFYILAEQFLYLGMRFFFSSPFKVKFIAFEVFTGIGTDDFDVGV